MGGQPPLRQRQHRRRRRRRRRASCARCWSATSRATSSSPDRPTPTATSRRAFITTARRGQNLPASVPPVLTTAGHAARAGLGVRRRRPRRRRSTAARRRSSSSSATRRARWRRPPDGSTVYAAVFHSGNQTTTRQRGRRLRRRRRRRRRAASTASRCRAGCPAARCRAACRRRTRTSRRSPGPRSGLIVKLDPANGLWEDELGRNWTNAVRFDLPDRDVFAIDALADPPIEIGSLRARRHGALQHDGQPERRRGLRQQHRGAQRGALRGPGNWRRPPCAATCTRRASRSSTAPTCCRATSTSTSTRCRTATAPCRCRPASRTTSLATPLGMALASDGTLYVAAFGSSASACSHARRARERHLRARLPPTTSRVSGGGPSGAGARRGARPPLRADPLRQLGQGGRHRDQRRRSRQHPLHNPEPPEVVDGRPLPLRRALHLEQRRGVVLELPRLRRLRQPRLGPRQSRRRRRCRTPTRSGPSAAASRSIR